MNIFISNLSWAIKDGDLRELFAEYGEITSAKVIMVRETGKSRGFGFVEMPNEEEGKKAIEELDKAEYDGKVITVNVAKPREERTGGSRGGFGGGNRGGGFGGGSRGGNGGGNRGGSGGYDRGSRRSY
ncbi:MAG: RNA-binding protein [Bacteroidales bacterium]